MKIFLPWIYRIFAIIFIFVSAFTIVYTAMYFTPGLSAHGDHCPSAFSNPTVDTNDPALEFIKNNFIRDSSKTKLSSEQVLDSKESKIIYGQQQLSTLKEIDKLTQTPKYNSLLKRAQALSCNYKFEYSNSTLTYKSTKANDPNIFLRNLTGTNIIILWVLTVVFGAITVGLKKNSNRTTRLNKAPRLIIYVSFLLFLIFSSIAFSVLTKPEGINNSSCKISDAFTTQDTSYKPTNVIFALIKNGDFKPLSDSELVTSIERDKRTTLSDIEKQDLIDKYTPIRDETKQILSKIENGSDYKRFINTKVSAIDSVCVSNARYIVLFNSFIVLLGVFTTIFVFVHPNKNNDL